MPVITLPDGSQKSFDHSVSVAEVALSIGAGLAKAALAGEVNGQLVDAGYSIDADCSLKIITAKSREGLDVLRHSTAHLLAQAVKILFPSAQVTIGPVIEDGFFYDFAYERTFTPEDLAKIEIKMQELIDQDFTVIRKVLTRDEAIQLFEQQGEHYKVDIIKEIPADQVISLYQQGDFIDLCRGPHVPSTGKLGAFKLTKLAGAYWRGDAKNAMLQRIYGTVWADKKDLDAYLHRLEEAEKRDHRKIGKALDLFHLQEEAPGMVFWHSKGWTIYQVVEQYMRAKFIEHGYQEIRTPQIVDRSLWERSGHWDKFRQDMFHLELDERHYAVKPMSCPCHVQIFNQGLRSYRELPLRLAEFGCCHRNEASGALHGLMRTRGFTQDDAHIFCTEEQIGHEIERFIKMLFEVYHDFGLIKISVKLSTRPEQRVGSDETWDKAETALKQELDRSGLEWELLPGEGAFYGPKIEFVLEDCIGRRWTTGSVQLDFSMPVRLGAEYVTEESTKRAPVMLHRAIYGSLERFIAILIEEYEGRFPLWLAPIQVVMMSITDRQNEYVTEITTELQKKGIRIISDLRNEKIGFKIREHTLNRIPYLLVVGDREVDSRTVTVRTLSGEDKGSVDLDTLLRQLEAEVAQRGRV